MHQGGNDTSDHWECFYSSDLILHELRPPSQFGAFIVGEISRQCLIVDIGCGTGRDALFFSNLNYPVVGVDASEFAIKHCISAGQSLNLNASFFRADVHDSKLFDRIQEYVDIKTVESVLVYARFFLHAITEADEDALFALVKSLAEIHSTRFAVEFRTQKDATMPKTTAQHYRRFISPVDLVSKATRMGFNIEYFVEGFGFAKYKADDAHVARCLFSL